MRFSQVIIRDKVSIRNCIFVFEVLIIFSGPCHFWAYFLSLIVQMATVPKSWVGCRQKLMKGRESACNFFLRFFMCCKMNFEKLDRIIKDFACSLHPNTLNRALGESKLTNKILGRWRSLGRSKTTEKGIQVKERVSSWLQFCV